MENKNILFGILGSFSLVLIQTPIYQIAGMAFSDSGMIGGNTHIAFIKFISKFFSFTGFIFTIVFAVMLILNNIKFKKK